MHGLSLLICELSPTKPNGMFNSGGSRSGVRYKYHLRVERQSSHALQTLQFTFTRKSMQSIAPFGTQHCQDGSKPMKLPSGAITGTYYCIPAERSHLVLKETRAGARGPGATVGLRMEPGTCTVRTRTGQSQAPGRTPRNRRSCQASHGEHNTLVSFRNLTLFYSSVRRLPQLRLLV
jgi:hypothetical protein